MARVQDSFQGLYATVGQHVATLHLFSKALGHIRPILFLFNPACCPAGWLRVHSDRRRPVPGQALQAEPAIGHPQAAGIQAVADQALPSSQRGQLPRLHHEHQVMTLIHSQCLIRTHLEDYLKQIWTVFAFLRLAIPYFFKLPTSHTGNKSAHFLVKYKAASFALSFKTLPGRGKGGLF